MGFLGMGKKPGKNISIVSAEEVHQRLLALNRETAPYQILVV